MTIGPTRSSTKQAQSEEIERQTKEFEKSGCKIKREEIRKTRQVDLTWRNYADVAMEGKGDGEEV